MVARQGARGGGVRHVWPVRFVFFFNDTATTEIYTLSLHDALPICWACRTWRWTCGYATTFSSRSEEHTSELQSPCNLVCRLLLEKKKKIRTKSHRASGTEAQVGLTRVLWGHALAVRPLSVTGAGLVGSSIAVCFVFFFFNDTATTEIYTLSLHDALPICLSDVDDGFAWQPSPL